MRLIVLAAGDSFELDGFNKLLIKNPITKRTILEEYSKVFEAESITIVVGYKAMDVMSQYPQYDYIYNKKWQTTGSAYSLSLALSEEPCVVIESDFLISESVKKNLTQLQKFVVIKHSESRRLASFNAVVEGTSIKRIYKGKSNGDDPELLGLFKENDPEILREWKKNGIKNPHQYIGESYPYEITEIPYLAVGDKEIIEINTPNDFINFIKKGNE